MESKAWLFLKGYSYEKIADEILMNSYTYVYLTKPATLGN